MKISKYIKYTLLVTALGIGATSCDDFLDKPDEDGYNVGGYYTSDNECLQGVNYLYNSPWFDFMRGFIQVGDVMSGNINWGGSKYLDFSFNATDDDLVKMSQSLWAVVAHSNEVYNNIKRASGPSEATKKICMGECLTLKALSYFYLVRTFGEVPIIHDPTEVINSGTYNDMRKVQRADIYEYIIMTLEEAMKLLPAENQPGHIDYYGAEGLLAKVYLTKSGLGHQGSRSQEDLDNAAKYAKDVIDNSGRQLMPNYSDIFRLENNVSDESLIAWHWTASDVYTSANCLHQDLAPSGFFEFDSWGGWRAPSVDLCDAFGVDVVNTDPNTRIDVDTRRKATMMLAGDKYEYFWQDKGGFDPLRFYYDKEYGVGTGEWQGPSGTQCVKHLVGNSADHEKAVGSPICQWGSSLATHVLRLADVYLVYAEAVLGNNGSTSDASALAAFNAVRGRAIPSATPKTSITFEDVWKERRLELACEGDRWYDFVRMSYYDVNRAINEIKSQRRNNIWNINNLYKYYYENGVWDISKASEGAGNIGYDDQTPPPNVTEKSFTIPFTTEDVVFNPNLLADAIHVDVRATYSY